VGDVESGCVDVAEIGDWGGEILRRREVELRGLRPESATRQQPRFQSCSIAITAWRLAVTEPLAAPTATEGKARFGKQKSAIDFD
jgi:hypothetical protein